MNIMWDTINTKHTKMYWENFTMCALTYCHLLTHTRTLFNHSMRFPNWSRRTNAQGKNDESIFYGNHIHCALGMAVGGGGGGGAIRSKRRRRYELARNAFTRASHGKINTQNAIYLMYGDCDKNIYMELSLNVSSLSGVQVQK